MNKDARLQSVDPPRRAVLGGLFGLVASASIASSRPSRAQEAPASAPTEGGYGRFAYVGCRTTKERNARGEGIQVYKVDQQNGSWTHVQLVPGLPNPSYLCFDNDQRFLYAVHGDLGDVSSYSIDPASGSLTLIGQQSTQGKNPVYLAPDPSNRFIVLANYATGTVAVLPRNDDGSLGVVRQLENLPGDPGPDRVEQTSSHPHEIAWDVQKRWIIVPDKGLDRIFTFRFDAAQGLVVPADPPFVQVRPGSGPRHVAFHPTKPFAFVAHELGSTVGAYHYDRDRGALTPFQIIPSIPDSFVRANTAAEIAILPSGRFVLVSNRGADSIGVFAVDQSSGRLSPQGWTGSEGKGPRFFALDSSATTLYAANENSDSIVPFRIDAEAGRLTRAGDVIKTGSPVCIVFSTK